jgi:predicted NBD/HSP70 family sugar kinase/DNA-binding CsgD family transcriptional regulator
MSATMNISVGFSSASDLFDAGGRGLQHQGLRRANERAVLTLIAFNAGLSNADIARLSGLAPQTVSAILTDLDRAGLTTRGEVLRGRRGQPATPILLRADGAFAMGVEIGWRHIEAVLVDFSSGVLARRRKAHGFPDASRVAGEIAQMVASMAETLAPMQRARLRDLGVTLPTHISACMVAMGAPAEQVPLWQDLDIRAELARRTGLDITLVNDGNAACWAELIAFPRPRPADFIYFLIGRNIAAGIMGQGQLWEGPNGHSANLGAMLVDGAEGRPQPAQLVASVTALEQRLVAAGLVAPGTEPDVWDWDSLGAVLESWIIDSAAALARVAFNTMTVIESELVVIDSTLPRPVLARLVTQLDAELRHLRTTSHGLPRVLPGHLGGLAPATGAAGLTLYRRYFSRTLADLTG